MKRKEIDALYYDIVFAVMEKMYLGSISRCLKSPIESNVKLGKALIINRVKKVAPEYLEKLEAEDLKQFAKYLNGPKMRNLESLASVHRNQDNTNYAVDMFEMAICKYVSVYQKQAEKMAAEKNEPKM